MAADLFSPFTLRGTTLRNRLVVPPMCQYSAGYGLANDWHFAHLARFAMGGFGAIIVEATAVSPEGRITPGCLGLWEDAQIVPLARIAAFLRSQGAVSGIQLGHAGRKAACQRPWDGDGPLTAEDAERHAEPAWPIIAPSALPHAEGWQVPRALDAAGLERVRQSWRDATRRALTAGFDLLEVHAAHGYLFNEFLSPIANRRTDAYGGSRENRMRFPLEIIGEVRKIWPDDKPVSVRISSIDGVEGGWTIEDSVVFAKELKALGVDLVDCSSAGIASSYKGPSGPGYQVAYAERIRAEAGLATMAVGLVTEPNQAQAIVADHRADLVALGREALADPQWPLHAQRALGGDPFDFSLWPIQPGHWLQGRERSLARHRDKAA